MVTYESENKFSDMKFVACLPKRGQTFCYAKTHKLPVSAKDMYIVFDRIYHKSCYYHNKKEITAPDQRRG